MKKLSLIFTIFLIFLPSCDFAFGPGTHDYTITLPSTYSIWRTSAHNVILEDSSSYKLTIPAKIVEAGWDNKYILTKQLGLKADEEHPSYMVPDDSKIYFWILDIKNHKLYGPSSEKTYLKLKQKLGVSEKIELKDLDDF